MIRKKRYVIICSELLVSGPVTLYLGRNRSVMPARHKWDGTMFRFKWLAGVVCWALIKTNMEYFRSYSVEPVPAGVLLSNINNLSIEQETERLKIDMQIQRANQRAYLALFAFALFLFIVIQFITHHHA